MKGDASVWGLEAAAVAVVGLALAVKAQGRCGGLPGTEDWSHSSPQSTTCPRVRAFA